MTLPRKLNGCHHCSYLGPSASGASYDLYFCHYDQAIIALTEQEPDLIFRRGETENMAVEGWSRAANLRDAHLPALDRAPAAAWEDDD
jgi:hypothetical protein